MASVPFAQSIWPTSRDGERQRTSSRATRPGASPRRSPSCRSYWSA